MGLDAWAKAVKGEPRQDEDGYTVYDDEIHLGDWRKHSGLQGWMENLWRSKGGEGEFNCVPVELNGDDLQSLRIDVDHRDLPSTQGFLFGKGNDEYYKDQDLTFVEEALDLIEAGYKVEYNSWW
tara:strand:+ start:92 stop:463 length:372 start_codon:yes stop_codon:yes gene_type:complete